MDSAKKLIITLPDMSLTSFIRNQEVMGGPENTDQGGQTMAADSFKISPLKLF
jgi:hypothetical protein